MTNNLNPRDVLAQGWGHAYFFFFFKDDFYLLGADIKYTCMGLLLDM